jgi:hypothetical protein
LNITNLFVALNRRFNCASDCGRGWRSTRTHWS